MTETASMAHPDHPLVQVQRVVTAEQTPSNDWPGSRQNMPRAEGRGAARREAASAPSTARPIAAAAFERAGRRDDLAWLPAWDGGRTHSP